MKTKKKQQIEAEIRVKVLKKFLKIVGLFVDEVKLCFSADGLRVKAIDAAHVAMLDLFMKSDAFEKYNAKNIEIVIHVENIMNVLKIASQRDKILLKYDTSDEYLIVGLNNLKRRIRCLDKKSIPDMKMPSLTLPSQAVVQAKEFFRGVKAAKMIADSMKITIDQNMMELSANEDTDQVKLTIPKEKLKEHTTNGKNQSIFSISYVYDVINILGKKQLLRIHIGTDSPLHLEGGIADGNSHLDFILAPRIEQNE